MRRRDAAVVLLFLISGTSGLVFEVVWVRYLTLVIGHTTFAVSVVVSAFLGGLAAGSLMVGRIAGNTRRPLLVYAGLEAATACLALGVTAILRNLDALSGSIGIAGGGPQWLRVATAFLLVVPPTAAMGGTLPMLTRFVARELPKVGKHFGLLYGMNTLGAAVGCALAGFYLIGAYGLWATAAIAASTNLIVALLAAALHRLSPGETSAAAERDEGPQNPVVAPRPRSMRTLLIVAFALAGFASISYEVLWFRVLGFFLPSTSYAFTVLLVTFLLGLVLGSVVYATRLAGRVRDLEIFVAAELLLAFLGLLSMVLLGHSQVLRSTLNDAFPARFRTAAMLVHAGIVMLVPTTVIGVVFPAMVQLTTLHLKSAGKSVGLLYSVNTLGGILGSLAIGFYAIPSIGTQWSFVLISLLSALIAVVLVGADPLATKRVRLRTCLGALLLFPMVRVVPSDYLVRRYAEMFSGETLRVVEGRDGLLSVIEYSYENACGTTTPSRCPARCREHPWKHRQLRFASMSYASTVLAAKRYMGTLANLPMLTHAAPKDVLLVCFGTGTTAGAFASYPELASLTVVDLNPDVIAVSELFAKDNHAVMDDPRTHVVIDDGRHFLLTTVARYDVISFEPPPPTSAGTVSLYTTEFYRLIAKKLTYGGLLTQWIPLDEQSDAQNRMLVKSLLDVFQDVTLWIPARHEAVLLASNRPLRVDLAQWRARWGEPGIAQGLGALGFATPEALLGAFVLDRAALERYAAQNAAVTDDVPAVEYPLQRNDGPFDSAALFSFAGGASSLVPAATPGERARIEVEQRASRLLVNAHDEDRRAHPAEARRLVAEAAKIAGDNVYTDYLANVEYDCMLGSR